MTSTLEQQPSKAEIEVISRMTFRECWSALLSFGYTDEDAHDLTTNFVIAKLSPDVYGALARMKLGTVYSTRKGQGISLNLRGLLVARMHRVAEQSAAPKQEPPVDGTHRL